MSNSTHLYRQLLDFLRQYSHASDLRHLKALAWMVSALICSGQLSLPAWEPYVPSRAKKAQSVERLRLAPGWNIPERSAVAGGDFWAMSGFGWHRCMCLWCWLP